MLADMSIVDKRQAKRRRVMRTIESRLEREAEELKDGNRWIEGTHDGTDIE